VTLFEGKGSYCQHWNI